MSQPRLPVSYLYRWPINALSYHDMITRNPCDARPVNIRGMAQTKLILYPLSHFHSLEVVSRYRDPQP